MHLALCTSSAWADTRTQINKGCWMMCLDKRILLVIIPWPSSECFPSAAFIVYLWKQLVIIHQLPQRQEGNYVQPWLRVFECVWVYISTRTMSCICRCIISKNTYIFTPSLELPAPSIAFRKQNKENSGKSSFQSQVRSLTLVGTAFLSCKTPFLHLYWTRLSK